MNAGGFDSVPSDISAYLSVQALKKFSGGQAVAGKSISAYEVSFGSGSISGGSLSTAIDAIRGLVPKDEAAKTTGFPDALSPGMFDLQERSVYT